MLFAAAVTACAALGIVAPSALAVFEGVAGGGATGVGDSESSAASQFFLQVDQHNIVGGHGYAEASLQFTDGRIAARTHGCIGPVLPTAIDTASGSSGVNATHESLAVYTPDLNTGVPITMSLCLSFTSNVYGGFVDPALITSASAGNQFAVSVAGHNAYSGGHTINVKTNVISGFGVFNGATHNTESFDGEYVFTAYNGIYFDLTITAGSDSFTSGKAAATPDQPSNLWASAGFGMTFGLHTTQPNVSFIWKGAPWYGTCGDSASLVPPNPAEPAPSTLLACLGGVALASPRRRERHER